MSDQKRRFISKLKGLGKKRAVLWVVITLLLAWLVFYFALQAQKPAIKDALIEARSSLQQEASALAELPDPRLIEKGQQDTALDFIISESKMLIDTENISPIPSRPSLVLLQPFNANWKRDVAQLDRIGELGARTDQLMSHHSKVLDSVSQVLRYNPQADVSSPSLSDQEITSRITAAREGIAYSQTELNQLSPYSDSDNLEGLKSALSTLQSNLDDFDQTRNKSAWYIAVNSIQDKIIASRQSFWTIERDTLLTQYAEANQILSNILTNL